MDEDATPPADDLDALVARVDPDRWLSSRLIAEAQDRADVIVLYAYDHELARAPKVASNALLGDFTGMIPSSITELLDSQKALLSLIPIAVMVPGIFAAIFILISSLCGSMFCKNKNQGSYCCTKCFTACS